MALLVNKFAISTPICVHNDNIGSIKNVPQVGKKFIPSSVKSTSRRALNDVSNKTPAIRSSNNCPPTKIVGKLPEVGNEIVAPVARLSLNEKTEHSEPQEIEQMGISDYDVEDDFCDILPLHLRSTLGELDWLIGSSRCSDDTSDLHPDSVPPADDPWVEESFESILMDFPELNLSDFPGGCLEDKTPLMELPKWP